MPEAAETKKKFSKSYQPKDPQTGEPLGPPQVFEADTREELVDMIAAAHENASVRIFELRRAAAVGNLMNFDPDQPIHEFKSRQLTADEKIRIKALRQDPNTAEEATRIEMEALLGTSIDKVHAMLNKAEIDSRVAYTADQVSQWLQKHPEYVQTETNRDTINKWLTKHKVPVTVKNLDYAYEALTAQGALITRQEASKAKETPVEKVEEKPTTTTVAATTPETKVEEKAAETVSPSKTEIPSETTPASAITETAEQVRARTSSSGLGRSNSSVVKTEVAKKPETLEITFAQINAMTSVQYAEACKNPAFKAAVEKLYEGRARNRA